VSPDVSPILCGVGNPPIGDPAVRVQAENPERSFQGLTVAQFDRMAPVDEVADDGGFNLGRTHGVPVPSIQPPARFHLNDCRENGEQDGVGHG
jgi:hypothetical protein